MIYLSGKVGSSCFVPEPFYANTSRLSHSGNEAVRTLLGPLRPVIVTILRRLVVVFGSSSTPIIPTLNPKPFQGEAPLMYDAHVLRSCLRCCDEAMFFCLKLSGQNNYTPPN